QDLPFDTLVEALAPQRDLAYSPLFQVAFGLDNTPKTPLDLSGLDHHPLPFDYESVRFDLTLWIVDHGATQQAYWTYTHDLYTAATITRMHHHYQTLLRSLTDRPDAPIDSLNIHTDAEHEQRRLRRSAMVRSHRDRLAGVAPKPIEAPVQAP
ncbi:MAG TPA: condensation domain-containing protein, partial [Frankiaceae bacterium]|nr:condensation domain-containing protein [Frankiaceae bacterium]